MKDYHIIEIGLFSHIFSLEVQVVCFSIRPVICSCLNPRSVGVIENAS